MPVKIIGRVLRSSTVGFAGACRLPEPDVPTFGGYVCAAIQRGTATVVGLVYNVNIDDDLFARQLAVAEGLSETYVADQQLNRQVPVEFSVLAVGYQSIDGYVQSLPPQPPMTLDPIHMCDANEIRAFTATFDFFRLVLATMEVPSDELLIAALRSAAAARPPSERRDFLIDAGRECARLLSRDLLRLDNLIRRLK
jgi:hypothetical protein